MSLKHNYHIAVPTAFYDNEALNIESTIKHIQYLSNKGVKSVLVCGSTGEQHSMTVDEKIDLIDCLSTLNFSEDFELIFGVSSIRQIDAQKLADKINKVPQISATLVGFPPYLLPSQKEAVIYAESIINAANKPTIIYNNPARTGFNMSIDSYKNLLSNDFVIGLKEAGDPHNVVELKKFLSTDFHYFVGGEKDLINKINLGFNGLSSITGNLYPIEVKQMFDSFLLDEKHEDYSILQKNIDRIHSQSLLPYLKKEISRREKIDFGICRSPIGN
jgi:4-hydroxy-tetrahydrodipicolinate synthase